MAFRFRVNPFTPGKRLTRPDIFSGRTSQLEAGTRLLVQAAAGRVRHGLITGDRGIGKSSLSSQIQAIAARDPGALQLVGLTAEAFPHEFLVAEHVAQRHQSVSEVAQGLLRDLDRQRGRVGRRQLNVDFTVDLKLFRATFSPGAEDRASDVTVGFVDQVEHVWTQVVDDVDGIVLVIDEIDRVAEQAGMATFFKVATEIMSARGLDNVLLLPVGMVGVQQLLAAEHSSINRVFEVVHLPKLLPEESMRIIDLALDTTGVRIDWKVNERIAFYSGGFPHPVHLIGSEAFEADTDDVIDQRDLEVAIESVVTERWKDQFDADYLAAGSGNNRDIIKAMANFDGGEDVPSAFICEALGVKQPQISSNINTLMKRDVIVRTDRGQYRFKDPLFRQYVKYLDILGSDPVEHRPRKRKRE